MESNQLKKYEGKNVVINTLGGNTFTGEITKVYENSVWMSEGYHINLIDIRDCEVSLQRVERFYFKESTGGPMLSGINLPKDEDGVVRDKYFIQCDFHPNCGSVRFENCTFSGCPGIEYLENRVKCTTKLSSTFCG